MKHSIQTALFLCTCISLNSAAQQHCLTETDKDKRLSCYDEALGYSEVTSPQLITTLPKVATTLAQERAIDSNEGTAEQEPKKILEQLSSNQANHFALVPSAKDSKTNETHLEFFLSIKYPLIDESLRKAKKANPEFAGLIPDKLYFVYNGRYDFFFNSDESLDNPYRSSPVYSRMQNPGLAFEWLRPETNDSFRLGYFHQSNGQTVDNQTPNSQQDYQYKLDKYGESYALANVSRGWDYLQLRWQRHADVEGNEFTDDWWKIQLEYRDIFDFQAFGASAREDDIWWDPSLNHHYDDFDGLRFNGERSFSFPFWKRSFLLQGKFRTGTRDLSALENITGKISLGTEFFHTHFQMFYFSGYGKDISTYHIKDNYVGMGFEIR